MLAATIIAIGLPAVIFVLANSVYGIEQALEDASAYKKDSTTPFDEANKLSCWDYTNLLKGFTNNTPHALSVTVNTVGDLTAAWHTINNNPHATCLIAVNIPMRDYPSAWAPFIARRT